VFLRVAKTKPGPDTRVRVSFPIIREAEISSKEKRRSTRGHTALGRTNTIAVSSSAHRKPALYICLVFRFYLCSFCALCAHVSLIMLLERRMPGFRNNRAVRLPQAPDSLPG
jgi:hypothetical protein